MTPLGVWAPCRSRSSWLLKVWLIDSMTCRKGLNRCAPGRSVSPLRAGRNSLRPASASARSNSVVVVLVADQGLTWPVAGQVGVRMEDLQQGLAFVGFRAGQRESDGQPAQGGDQMQPQAPEVA